MADRLEREIEDVLSKVEDFEWHRQQRRRRQRRQRLQGLRPRIPFGGRSGLWPAHGRFRRVKPGHVMLGGFFLVAASFSFGPGGVWTWLLFGGVGLFLGAMLWSRRRGPSDPSGPSGGRSRGGWWRDRYITYDEPSRTARPPFWRRRR